MSGGYVSDGSSAPSRSLAELIKGRDTPAIDTEFNRALSNVNPNSKMLPSSSSPCDYYHTQDC